MTEAKKKTTTSKSKKEGNPFGEEKELSQKSDYSFVDFVKDERFHRVVGLFLVLFSVFLVVAFSSYLFNFEADEKYAGKWLLEKGEEVKNIMGIIGFRISYLALKSGFGIASYMFALISLVLGIRILIKHQLMAIPFVLRFSFFILIWLPVLLAFVLNPQHEIYFGAFGYYINQMLIAKTGKAGDGIILLFVFLSFLILEYNLEFKRFFKPMVDTLNDTIEKAKHIKSDRRGKDDQITEEEDFTLVKNEPGKKPKLEKKEKEEHELELIIENEQEMTLITKDEVIIKDDDVPEMELKTVEEILDLPEYNPTDDLPHYKYPTLDLLDEYGDGTINVQKEELEANKKKIVETLNNYDIQIDKIKATIGPTVTLYEIVPAPGIRISRIKNLEDDIALSLAALGIRIIAPIPGKGTIGIEVPNLKPEVVSMKSMLSSEKFVNSNYELPIALGKTISNESFIVDLTKMPHLLVAGATGQGKSVGLNAIIASILYKKHPSQVKFVLVDPKKVELTLFSKLEKHFLAKLHDSDESIITDTKKVVKTLKSLCVEMDDRYNLLNKAEVRNLKEYNAKFVSRRLNPNKGHRYLPYIILVIDEFADLIMTAGKEVEQPLTRLAQLARAIGIHLIIATQRPSVNIITGIIKANFPARIAFRVISKIDSRTILDMGGADQLIGRGDMLLSTGSDLTRLQCAFLDTHEVDRITKFIGDQMGFGAPMDLPLVKEDGDALGGDNGGNDDERDDMFKDAARVIVQNQQGSTSLIQRKLKLGYNRAGRIMDQLEKAGIVGPFEGSKAREVNYKDLSSLEDLLKNLN